jgi:hypothetical protein
VRLGAEVKSSVPVKAKLAEALLVGWFGCDAIVVSGPVLSTTRLPSPNAKSLALVAAFTVKGTTPPGVTDVVPMVSVAVLEVLLGVKETGFGEKDAVTPAGSVEVIVRVAVNAPLPVPRSTVTRYVAPAEDRIVAGVCGPTTTDPTLGPSLNVVSAWRPSLSSAVSLRTLPMESSGLTTRRKSASASVVTIHGLAFPCSPAGAIHLSVTPLLAGSHVR